MKEKTERNIEIYNKKMNGETYRRLSIEYDLSINTLQLIIKRYTKNGKTT